MTIYKTIVITCYYKKQKNKQIDITPMLERINKFLNRFYKKKKKKK